MSVYNYVAGSDPNKARRIIDSFGYEVSSNNNLGQSLNELVNQEGEPALKIIMEAHPDKDIILELFARTNNKEEGCGCSKCKEKNHGHYLNADGTSSTSVPSVAENTNSNTTTLAHQTNVILIVATLFIATALIIKKN